MNRRGFLKLLPLLPVAAKAVALAAEAPVIFAASRVGKSIAPGNCMAFSSGTAYIVHPKQLELFRKHVAAGNQCGKTVAWLIANRYAPPDHAFTFEGLSPSDAGYWRAACPT